MVREKLNKALANCSGCAENAYVTPFHPSRIAIRGRRSQQAIGES
jgi:hypothetical protein